MDITNNGGTQRLMGGDFRISGGDDYGEGQHFSEGEFVKILANRGRLPPSPPLRETLISTMTISRP